MTSPSGSTGDQCVADGCNAPRVERRFLCAEHAGLVDKFRPAAASVDEKTARKAEKKRIKVERTEKFGGALERSMRRPGDVHIVCPHCQAKGRVTSRIVRQKKGISGGKAVGAIFTGGASMLATGLSRKEKSTEMHCHICNTTWYA